MSATLHPDCLPTMPASRLLRVYLLESRHEFLKVLRTPAFALPTLLFPLLFYVMFGIVLNRGGSGGAAPYLLATYGVFGIMGPPLFGFGVGVAVERAQGTFTLKRALPMPPGAYLLAKVAMSMLFAILVSGLLMLAASLAGGVRLQPAQWTMLLLINTFGTLPFCALGLWIGTLVKGNGAAAVVNLIYLPMALLSGLWLPLSVLPAVLGKLAPAWPSHHLAQLTLKVIGRDAGQPAWLHVTVLLVVTVVFAMLARARLRDAE